MKIGNKDKSIYMNRIVMFNLIIVIFLTVMGKFIPAIILFIMTVVGRAIQNIMSVDK